MAGRVDTESGCCCMGHFIAFLQEVAVWGGDCSKSELWDFWGLGAMTIAHALLPDLYYRGECIAMAMVVPCPREVKLVHLPLKMS